ncbi:MAG: BrnT family toxin [Planctomycetota bacterium]
MRFEWDPRKAEINERKHGVKFEEGVDIFEDPLSMTGFDPDHSMDEERYITIGQTKIGRFLVVSHTDRYGAIRIISARRATRREIKDYEDVG